MTENEAIKHLQSYAEVVDDMIKYCKDFEPKADITGYLEKKTVFAMAISAIKEVQQYREIGTVEECKEAVRKQKPRGCLLESKANWTNYKCPACGQIKLSIYKRGNRYIRPKETTKYCENCGQALLDEDLQEPRDEQKKMTKLNLGDFCKECRCAKCYYRECCGALEGNTNWYCHNECKGQAGTTNRCSEFSPMPTGEQVE